MKNTFSLGYPTISHTNFCIFLHLTTKNGNPSPQAFQLDDSGEAHSSAGDDRFLQWFSIGDWLGTDKQLQGADDDS